MTFIRQGDITGFDDAEVLEVEGTEDTEDTDDISNSKSHSV